ncbi:MAG: 30S ribosomal protein S4 [Candidatus Komeilibacteria bacterium]|nr:30S ribosomal protein S4 [Candidatus Komeilibacteria bacterium]
MGRYTGPKWKQSRREGVDLRDGTKSALVKRNYPPGAHGPMSQMRRLSGYGKQLREKQRAKRIYGLYEKQFHTLYEKAVNMTGNASVNLRQLLENRLDNIIYRAGWADTRPQARQLVSHGHIQVDGRKVDIPSFQVKPGMKIQVKPSYLKKAYWTEQLAKLAKAKKEQPSNVSFDPSTNILTVTSLPNVEELAVPFDPTLIIEFYSK